MKLASTTSQGLFSNISAELYPIIASHLPLYATSPTLLALALTNRHISDVVLPLLYSILVLKNEADALHVLQRLLDDPPFGRVVRELHVICELSNNIQNPNPPSAVIRRVEEVVSSGYLPFIHTFNLTISWGWYYDPERNLKQNEGYGNLSKAFVTTLKQNCPRLRCLILRNFGEYFKSIWIEESGILQAPDTTRLAIRLRDWTLQRSAVDKLFEHVSSLSASLHTLELIPGYMQSTSTSPIFNLDLPCLRSLTLSTSAEVDTEKSMAFFKRHPSIEYLDISLNDIRKTKCWFSSELPDRFLPNLLHLRARWAEARLLAPILPQLISLSIHRSINAQIPYLLRSVIPNGLPLLKSLDIGQSASVDNDITAIEGSLWYESKDGTFRQANKRNQSRTVFESFMHSIVRAAPNLEELAFHGSLFPILYFVSIANDLNDLPHLKHLYCEGSRYDIHSSADRLVFTSHAKEVADAVPSLVSITNVANVHPPFLTAKVGRNSSGGIAGVKTGKGFGMKIGYEDEAFPWAPRGSTRRWQ
ncbi:hypothetical protein CPB84DRAFT_1966265 [Gymnopilus junonius]|uniref:Uncharacterized protein n=1 Tax=Gymnopilus junonius TaxID=109634 RepID=A0A9P5TGD0_GYMJU|nr:hypothetical protein CPB84DRAFT_1966265 [Gymnopilus junonius]